MNGAAWIKSHVLRRDEKGMFGIPFKRILLVLIVSGCTYSFGKIIFGEYAAIPALISLVGTLIYTAEIGGIPRYKRTVFDWRGRLMGAASEHPEGLASQICEMFQLPVDEIMMLDGSTLFKPKTKPIERDDALVGWEIVTAPEHFSDGGRGMVFVDKPLANLALPSPKGTQIKIATAKVAIPAKVSSEG